MKCKTCPTRKGCWDYGNCDGCDIGAYIIKLLRKIERLKKENTRLKEKTERRGRWRYIFRTAHAHISCALVCNVCGACTDRIDGAVFNYCPKCGAKMDGEEDTKQ